jgi:nicotinamide-nucleotide amidase
MVEIITIGDELLIGQVVDTNSAWMAAELNKNGFRIKQITSVSDDQQHIIEAINNAFTRAQIVLLTGGLGPTKDDITKHTLCKYFDAQLVFNQAVHDNIFRLFSHRFRVMNELTMSQAMVPNKAIILQNKNGTAPITWFNHEDKVLVSLPGVPYEMKAAMEEVIPMLREKFCHLTILHRTFIVVGLPESALAILLADWENNLPEYIKLAYLPNENIVKLRLSGSLPDENMLKTSMDIQAQQLHELLGKSIVADEDLPLEVIVGKLLKEKGLQLAIAESCTGGNIAHLITSVAGSSAYFKGGVVAYSNEIKQNLLRVSSEDLQQYGAVSEQVVRQMAEGALLALGADVAIATSGIAGPDGGTEEKPVGLVCISVCSKDKNITRSYQYSAFRDRNISRASITALVLLKELIALL